jgi:ubiquinone/menaquinone biosynthesis C-methylase UbiE
MSRRQMFRRIVAIVATVAVIALAVLAIVARSALAKAEWSSLFSRDGWQLPQRVLSTLDVQPGDSVADLGAGNGYFIPHLAAAVGPTGLVYAVDVEPEVVAKLEARVAALGLTNVETLLGQTDDPLLPDGKLDLVFLCNVYHHISDRVAYFERLRRDLAADGRIAIIDIKDDSFSRLLVPRHHWTERGNLLQEMAAAGYRSVASFDYLPTQSFEVFAPEER